MSDHQISWSKLNLQTFLFIQFQVVIKISSWMGNLVCYNANLKKCIEKKIPTNWVKDILKIGGWRESNVLVSFRVVKVLKYHISVYIITGLRGYLRGGWGKGAFWTWQALQERGEGGRWGIRLEKYFHISVHCTVCYDTVEGREIYKLQTLQQILL